MRSHPSQRFEAPRSIQTGSSLAELFNPIAIELIGESFAAVSSEFDYPSYFEHAVESSSGLPLKGRCRAIARALRAALPSDDHAALNAVLSSLGPELTRTEDNGLAVMFYMPHSALLEGFGATNDDTLFDSAIETNFALTCRFTAEFSIRTLLETRLDRTLEALRHRLDDPNPHIRRLISEGTRSRLPWARHLKTIRDDPNITLPLLKALRDDPDRYVTRSVANHLGDIGKDHPDVLLDTCSDWLDALESAPPLEAAAKERRWLVRHAVRHPAKKRNARALSLRQRAKP